MITWEKLGEYDGLTVYKRIDEDGIVRVTAVEGYSELDDWLKANSPEVKETPETPEAE